jgi:hypothetical protein
MGKKWGGCTESLVKNAKITRMVKKADKIYAGIVKK